jgi:hypothetical protein
MFNRMHKVTENVLWHTVRQLVLDKRRLASDTIHPNTLRLGTGKGVAF